MPYCQYTLKLFQNCTKTDFERGVSLSLTTSTHEIFIVAPVVIPAAGFKLYEQL